MAKHYSKRTKNLPATQGMLYETREELKSEMRGLQYQLNSLQQSMEARFSQVDAKFSSMDSKFRSIDAKFSSIDSRFSSIDAKLSKMDASLHEIKLLVEEQNARNIYVLDGLVSLFNRQERVEGEVAELKELVVGGPK